MRGFTVNAATMAQGMATTWSLAMGDVLQLHLLVPPASLHVSGVQDMVLEPCMLDLPHRHPRMALALLHVHTHMGTMSVRSIQGSPAWEPCTQGQKQELMAPWCCCIQLQS